MKNIGIIVVLLVICFLALFWLIWPGQTYSYGEQVSLVGKVELRTYPSGDKDQLEAYVLVLDDSIQTQRSEGVNYGMETMIGALHLDLDNEKIAPYHQQTVHIQARIRPSENIHHLGHACLYEIEIQ